MTSNSDSSFSPISEVFIEIQKDSNLKYEFDKSKQKLQLDRVLHGTNFYPGDYGFIENTLELDGDPIDVLIFSEYSIFPGCLAEIKIVGGLEMIDAGEVDNKLIAVYTGNPATTPVNSLEDVCQHWKKKVWDFFLNYKNVEQKKVSLKRWLSQQEAVELLLKCRQRFRDQFVKR